MGKWRVANLTVALMAAALALTVVLPAAAQGDTAGWELVNPEGIVIVDPVKINSHPVSLEGKTVVLFWNGKHNGNNFLDRVAEHLAAEVKGVRILKSWEAPLNVAAGQNVATQMTSAWKKAGLKPDLVIASQAD